MPEARRLLGFAAVLVAAGCAFRTAPAPPAASDRACVPVGRWVDPATQAPLDTAAVIDAARRRRIVLLGERHDWVEDHRWQAYVIGLLHASHPRVIVGFEAFTPDADAALGRWVAGELTAEALLDDAGWRETWGFPPDLYLPLFHLGRLLGLDLRGVNVERTVVRRIARTGYAGLDDADRARVPAPRPTPAAHRARLARAWEAHSCRPAAADDPAFGRFIEAQRTWDGAMAARLAGLAAATPDAIVVGIVGRGHAEYGDGIPADLAALGREVLVLLPWETAAACTELPRDVADAVFGIAPRPEEIPEPTPSPCEAATAAQAE